MIRAGLAGMIIVVAAVAPAAGQQPIQGGLRDHRASAVYEDFMALPANQRRTRFAAMAPEHKASVMRTHTEGWIHANKGRLTTSEIAVFEEMVAYVTPEAYRSEGERVVDQSYDELTARMTCRVSPEDVRASTNLFAASPPSGSQTPTWNYLDQARCWGSWLLEWVSHYIPQ